MKIPKIRRFIYKLWKEWRVTIFFIVFVIIPAKSSLADWNWVPTGSMNPTILEGDLIYVNKIAYDLRFPLTLHRLAKWSNPQIGDIVVCFSPHDGARLVKRVINRLKIYKISVRQPERKVHICDGRPGWSYSCHNEHPFNYGYPKLRADYGTTGQLLCYGRQQGQ